MDAGVCGHVLLVARSPPPVSFPEMATFLAGESPPHGQERPNNPERDKNSEAELFVNGDQSALRTDFLVRILVWSFGIITR
jgi:hypothetical protein